MAAAHSLSSSLGTLFVGICLLFITAAHLSFHVADAAGFSMELIHRDSPKSPLYDSASTPFSRLHDSLDRSISRANYLRISNSHNSDSPLHEIFSYVTHSGSEFHMVVHIGSQKMWTIAIMDTVGIFNWVLCYPCKECQKDEHSIFNPMNSESYNKVNCSDHQCSFLPHRCVDNDKCEYLLHNNDKTKYNNGILSRDTLELDPTPGNEIVDHENIIIGCTHRTNMLLNKISIGIISLSRGPLSLVSQLGERSYGKKFSYCLPYKKTMSGRLNFGSAAKISGPGAVTTPLINGINDNAYILRFLKITVAKAGDQPIIVKPLHDMEAAKQQTYNIVMDSNTAYTFIDSQAMLDLSEEVKKHTPQYPPKERYKSMREILYNNFDLCLYISEAQGELRLPSITFHFLDDAPLVLNTANAFVKVDTTTVCLGILSNARTGGISILGSFAQLGYHILLDVDNNKATFRREECQV